MSSDRDKSHFDALRCWLEQNFTTAAIKFNLVSKQPDKDDYCSMGFIREDIDDLEYCNLKIFTAFDKRYPSCAEAMIEEKWDRFIVKIWYTYE